MLYQLLIYSNYTISIIEYIAIALPVASIQNKRPTSHQNRANFRSETQVVHVYAILCKIWFNHFRLLFVGEC